jgi:hypothetical protein
MRTLNIHTLKESLKTKPRESLLRITLIILDEYEKALDMLDELYGKIDEMSNIVTSLEEEE